ncbi:hypothetical protein CBOM_01383 [Ceraceosorus bombacis]|uniref:Uncharacterized protein n=1 Tax=Ceraceosorus bombacis TaxID=401625 RepID=A0A0P1BCJ0_9BASI|nr:hypothetical protein CBOM_01383 [Ceraceosorus bombacis]
MPSNSQYRPLTRKPGGAGGPAAPAAPLVLQAGKVLTAASAVFIFLSLVASLGPGPATSGSPRGVRRTGVKAPLCDPFSLPGYLARLGPSLAAPNGLATWRTFDPACSASPLLPSFLSSLPSTAPHHLHTPSASSLAMLSNSTVLLVGDATDSTLLTHLCDIAGERVEKVDGRHPWSEALRLVPKNHRWPNNDAAALKLGAKPDDRAEIDNTADKTLAQYCYLPDHDFFVASVSHYGTDTSSKWRDLPTYVTPALFEDRVTDLFLPFTKAITSTSSQHRAPSLPPPRAGVDLVVFNSGLWDLAGWAKEDIKAGRSATSDLSESRLLEWRARSPKNHPLFSLNRLSALDNARSSVLRPHGDDVAKGLRDRGARLPKRVRSMPWGELLLGQAQLDPISPSLETGGSVFVETLLHQVAVAAAGY